MSDRNANNTQHPDRPRKKRRPDTTRKKGTRRPNPEATRRPKPEATRRPRPNAGQSQTGDQRPATSQQPRKARRPAGKRPTKRHAGSNRNYTPRHTTHSRKRSRTPIVVGCIVALVLLMGGFFAVRALIPQHQEATSSESQATGASSQQPQTTQANQAASSSSSDNKETASGSSEAQPKSNVEVPKRTGEPASINVMMIGDVLMHDEIIDSGAQSDGSYNFDFVYDNIKEYIDAADWRILNQETVMGSPSLGYHLTMGAAGPKMNTPTALADSEARFGFNTILKATNHTLDLGYDGLGHELDYWKATYPNIPVVGVSNPNAPDDKSQDYVNNVYIFEKDGFKVGILNYTWATNENIDATTDATYISYMSEDKIRADVEKARAAGAEMLVACPHWGIEYDTTPSDEEQTYSKLFCDLGVDLIFGSHPHILQPVELLQNAEGHKTVCFYSMGNYVAASLMEPDSLVGGIARATLNRAEDGTYSVSAASLVPTVICHTYGPNMTAFPITKWTNDLAAQSTRPQLTPDYANSFCANVLGQGYDTSSGTYTLDVNGKARTV